MTKILACVDVSVYANSVVDHAAWAALRTDAAVHLLHVIGRKERGGQYDLSGVMGAEGNAVLLDQLAEADEKQSRLAQERGRALLDACRTRLQEQGVGEVAVLHRHGSFVETVTELEVEQSFVMIGKRGASADFATLHLGSNLERVVRACSKPVFVASRAFRPVERVLVAFDGGPSARKAVEYVATKPLFAGLDVHLVMAGRDGAEARTALDAARTVLERHGRAATTTLQPGEPEVVIGEYVQSRDIGLLVMGAYGGGRIRQFIVGSTTSAMIRTCLIPVMLFR